MKVAWLGETETPEATPDGRCPHDGALLQTDPQGTTANGHSFFRYCPECRRVWRGDSQARVPTVWWSGPEAA